MVLSVTRTTAWPLCGFPDSSSLCGSPVCPSSCGSPVQPFRFVVVGNRDDGAGLPPIPPVVVKVFTTVDKTPSEML